MRVPNTRIAVVGSGAVGGYYGAMLARRGFDVHFLLRSDYTTVKKNGWTVLSPNGDFHLPPERVHVYNDARQMPPADLVLIAIKTTENQHLPELLKPLIQDNTALLTLQNGLGNEEFLAQHFGAERILGGMAFLCSNREAPGVIRHIRHGLITLGEFAHPPGSRIAAIARFLDESGVASRVLPNLGHGRWEKLVWNIPFNGLGAVMDLTTDRLIGSEAGVKLVRAIMGEVLAIASALGHSFGDDLIDRKIIATAEMKDYRTSMQIDRQAGRPLEIEAIFHRPLMIAAECKVSAPRTTFLQEQLCSLLPSSKKTAHPLPILTLSRTSVMDGQ